MLALILAVALALPLLAIALAVLLFWLKGPAPSKDACKECGAEPGEECDRWTHNGV